jgi:hypothetical protein
MVNGSAFETFLLRDKKWSCFSHTVVPRMKREEEQIKLTINVGETPVSILYQRTKKTRKEKKKKKKLTG